MAVVLKPGQLEKYSRLRNGDMIDGKYQLKEVLGVGGMSVVWRAVDINLQKDWAIKETRKDKGHKKVQDNEIEVLKRLDHPGLPRIVGKSKVGDSDVIIMDLVEGKSLGDILKEEGAQDEKKVIEWSLQICDALYYLHSQNPPIIYKDMKPDNVMVRGENRDSIKIIDLGISVDKDTKLQKAGTPVYQPNEQREGYADERSDIYALGITMHYLVTGVKPKLGNYAPIRNWNPLLSEGLERIINKCVETDPSRRYQSMKGLINDLKHPEFITRGYRKKQKQKMGAFLAACCASAALVVGGFGLNVYADYQDNSNYELLLQKGTNADSKLENLLLAMESMPERPEAYISYLDTCMTDHAGNYFTEKRRSDFEKHYSAGEEVLKNTFSPEIAQLNYKAGQCYMYYSSSENDNEDLSAALRRGMSSAKEFLSLNHAHKDDAYYPEQNKSEAYYEICDYYTNFVGTPGDNMPDKAAMESVLNSMNITLKENPGDGKQGLLFCNTVLQLINSQISNMASQGIPSESVQSVITGTENLYKDIADPVSDENDKNTVELLASIPVNLETAKEKITTAYRIAGQKPDGSIEQTGGH